MGVWDTNAFRSNAGYSFSGNTVTSVSATGGAEASAFSLDSVAPGEKTCDHGGTPAPIRHARDEWQRDYEAAPLSPCICPPNVVVCGNVACPRAPRVTCGAGVEYPVGQTGPVLGMS